MVLDHNGRLKQALDHVFMALLVDDVSSGAVTSSGSYLTLELRFDLYPEEIGFQLRADTLVGAVAIQKRASSIIFFRAPGFYDSRHTNQVVRETIALPTDEAGSVKHYSLILLDSFGDGRFK